MSKVEYIIEMNEEDFKSIEYSTLLYHLHATPIAESDDCVSRQAVINAINNLYGEGNAISYTDEIRMLINILPPVNPTIIPKDATNGDIIKLLFPNKYGEQCGRTKVYYNIDAHNRMEFQIDWWNAPYKESEE